MLVRRLADHLLEQHPERAVRVLEKLGVGETVRLLGRGSAKSASELLRHLAPQLAAAILQELDAARAARIVDAMDLDVAARLVRRLATEAQVQILDRIEQRRSRGLAALLRFPESSAGALMDPDVLALPMDLTAREALAQVRESAAHARYNLYVVDRDQRLAGVLTLRELLQARPRTPLSDLMVPEPQRLLAEAGREAVLSHPGWKQVHSLPVVDGNGAYLGAIRYRTLRSLERELRPGGPADVDASSALGELLAATAGGLLDALSGPVRTGGSGGGA
jgi:magnesium transporter